MLLSTTVVDASTRIKVLEDELDIARAAAAKGAIAKARFIANVSHEIHTPLNAIIGFSDLLCQSRDNALHPDKQREYLIIIQESGRRLLSMLDNILEMARIEGGQVELKDSNLQISPLLRSVIQLISAEATKANVRIDLDVADDPVLIADERAVRRVLVNVVHNAIKFNRSSGHVRVAARAESDGGISIAISDTGIGIDEKNIPILLEVFTQESDDLARNYEGGGLGLSIAKGLLALHNADLTISSKVGVGTTVTITFPRHRTLDNGIDLDATMIHIPRVVPNLDNALFLEFGGRKVSVFPGSGKCVLGRNRETPEKIMCDVVVEDRRVSRPHAHVRYENDGYYLLDESRCGTYVVANDRPTEYSCRGKPIRLKGRGAIYLGVAPDAPDAQPITFWSAGEKTTP